MSRHTRHAHRHRTVRLALAGAALGSVGLTTFAGLAAASEFVVVPGASLGDVVCAAKAQPQVQITLTNVGSIDGYFDVLVNGVEQISDRQVTPAAPVVVAVVVPEDQPSTVEVREAGVTIATFSVTPDCFGLPTADITVSCSAKGLIYESTYVNPAPSVVSFATTRNGIPSFTIDRNPFSSGQLAEGQIAPPVGPWSYQVSVDGAVILDRAGDADCVDPSASAEMVCTDEGPTLLVTLRGDDVTTTAYRHKIDATVIPGDDSGAIVALDGFSSTSVQGGTGDATIVKHLVEDSPWTVNVDAYDVDLLDASGVASCDEPTVTTETTITTEPSTTAAPAPTEVPATPVPATEVRLEAQTPTTAVAMLPTTGPARETGMAAIGAVLLGLGAAVVRLSRRPTAR